MAFRRRSAVMAAVALPTAATLLLTGCSSSDDTSSGSEGSGGAKTTTIEWWHISNQDPMRSFWAQKAKEYQASHPGVKINITVLENEAFKTKLTTVTQTGKAPDIFQTWGGGVLKQQADAGLVKDITNDISSWGFTPAALAAYQIDGKAYGLPYDVGMVGFWYNKALFKKAGIDAPPTTWAQYLDDVKKLKSAGITPIALAGADKWPDHYYWAYLAMREAGLPALKQAAVDHNFNTPAFIKAGQDLKQLADLQPFQKGWQGAKYDTPDGEAATMGNGEAAMELMGQWAPTTEKASSGKGIGDDLGFFTFPMVDGGAGNPGDAFGGGNGFAVGKDAPPATIDFLKYLSSVEVQKAAVATGSVQPVVKGAEAGLTDPNLKTVADTLASATGFQLYLDQAFAPAVGAEVNDSVAALLAGQKTPEQVVQDITTAAKSE
jgi:raffinose/stachyose/melibiose transport system substrate-binding protein